MVGRAPALAVVLIAGLVLAGVLLRYDRLGAGPRSLEHTAGGAEPAAGALVDGAAPAVAATREGATPQPPAEREIIVVEATPDAPLLRVVGKVVDAEDAPVPGATLWLSEPNSTTEGAIAGHADAAGSFALERVRAPACLWAWAPDWAPSTPALVLDESDIGVEVRLRLSVRGMTIRGLVVDPAEQPIAGAEVWIGSRFEEG